MHGFSALESINEKINEELASQDEDDNDDEDALEGCDQKEDNAENTLSDDRIGKELKQSSSDNDQSQKSQNTAQHEGGENADAAADQLKRLADE